MSRSFACPDCKTNIPGTNCAFTLSRAEGWKNKSGCTAMCKCGYPVRAKDVRDNIFSGELESDKKSTTNAYIYCESDSSPDRHVCYGTYDTCVTGNGLAAAGMSSIGI